MIGKTISHYRIIEQIGVGGMGIVYKAEDTKLKRTVALKFLPPEMTRDPEAKARFIHEAKAASALQHNQICTIHDIDETEDGQIFIVMDYYEGQTLKEVIGTQQMTIDKIMDAMIQIASGLQKAHEKGIVHRDIKPANIMVTTDGEVKIMDFGLAKLAGQTRLTKTGSTVGTVMYMSPEQARGEAVDHRTDIWALGVVFYEMISGQSPFKGEYDQAVFYGILNEEPKPLTSLRSGIPLELEQITGKMLAKNPAKRYQHLNEILVDLKKVLTESASGIAPSIKKPPKPKWYFMPRVWLAVAFIILAVFIVILYTVFSLKHETSKPPTLSALNLLPAVKWKDSIAVLPIRDLSPQQDQEYFCEGMMEEIIRKLSNIHDLKVISRTSAMRYRSTDKSIREIGQELGVGAILEGSLQKEKDRIRITAQLIRTDTDAHLWAERYDRKLSSIFEVQDEISLAIVEALKLQLTSQEKQRIIKPGIDNAAAYDLYLQAMYDIRQFNENSTDRAIQDLQKSIEIIGKNALLYAGLAYAYFQYFNMGIEQEKYIDKSYEYSRMALELDPDCHKAYFVLGIIQMTFFGNQREALSSLKKALALDPNDTDVLIWLGVIYGDLGKLSALKLINQRLVQVNPLDPFSIKQQGNVYWYTGQYSQAIEAFYKAYQSDTNNIIFRISYAEFLIMNEKFDEAYSIIDETVRLNPNNIVSKHSLLMKYAVLKDKERAFQIMTPEFQQTCKRDLEWSWFVARMLSLLNEREEALHWLENAVNRGYINYPFLSQYDPFLENIRSEERFKKLMERVKYQWEHFEE